MRDRREEGEDNMFRKRKSALGLNHSLDSWGLEIGEKSSIVSLSTHHHTHSHAYTESLGSTDKTASDGRALGSK